MPTSCSVGGVVQTGARLSLTGVRRGGTSSPAPVDALLHPRCTPEPVAPSERADAAGGRHAGSLRGSRRAARVGRAPYVSIRAWRGEGSTLGDRATQGSPDPGVLDVHPRPPDPPASGAVTTPLRRPRPDRRGSPGHWSSRSARAPERGARPRCSSGLRPSPAHSDPTGYFRGGSGPRRRAATSARGTHGRTGSGPRARHAGAVGVLAPRGHAAPSTRTARRRQTPSRRATWRLAPDGRYAARISRAPRRSARPQGGPAARRRLAVGRMAP